MLNQQHEEHLGAPTHGPEPESCSADAEGWERSSDLWLFRMVEHRERVWLVCQSEDTTRRRDGARSGSNAEAACGSAALDMWLMPLTD